MPASPDRLTSVADEMDTATRLVLQPAIAALSGEASEEERAARVEAAWKAAEAYVDTGAGAEPGTAVPPLAVRLDSFPRAFAILMALEHREQAAEVARRAAVRSELPRVQHAVTSPHPHGGGAPVSRPGEPLYSGPLPSQQERLFWGTGTVLTNPVIGESAQAFRPSSRAIDTRRRAVDWWQRQSSLTPVVETFRAQLDQQVADRRLLAAASHDRLGRLVEDGRAASGISPAGRSWIAYIHHILSERPDRAVQQKMAIYERIRNLPTAPPADPRQAEAAVRALTAELVALNELGNAVATVRSRLADDLVARETVEFLESNPLAAAIVESAVEMEERAQQGGPRAADAQVGEAVAKLGVGRRSPVGRALAELRAPDTPAKRQVLASRAESIRLQQMYPVQMYQRRRLDTLSGLLGDDDLGELTREMVQTEMAVHVDGLRRETLAGAVERLDARIEADDGLEATVAQADELVAGVLNTEGPAHDLFQAWLEDRRTSVPKFASLGESRPDHPIVTGSVRAGDRDVVLFPPLGSEARRTEAPPPVAPDARTAAAPQAGTSPAPAPAPRPDSIVEGALDSYAALRAAAQRPGAHAERSVRPEHSQPGAQADAGGGAAAPAATSPLTGVRAVPPPSDGRLRHGSPTTARALAGRMRHQMRPPSAPAQAGATAETPGPATKDPGIQTVQ